MASNDTVCWDKLIPHTVIGKCWHTIAITEQGENKKENEKQENTWEIASKLWHIPWTQLHETCELFWKKKLYRMEE